MDTNLREELKKCWTDLDGIRTGASQIFFASGNAEEKVQEELDRKSKTGNGNAEEIEKLKDVVTQLKRLESLAFQISQIKNEIFKLLWDLTTERN